MNSFHLRTASPEDLPRLLEFEQGLVKAERPFDPTIRPDPVNYYDIPELISSPETCLLVAEVQGVVVASGLARIRAARTYLDHEKYCLVGFMYTMPEYRGKGINKAIMQALVDWADSRGLKEVRLTVYPNNMPAVRAYEKAGFHAHNLEMRLVREKNQE